MTATAWTLLSIGLAAGVVDWIAVSPPTPSRRVEYLAKPTATLAVIGVALAMVPADPARRAWFVAAFVLCFAGDVLLMLPQNVFVPGLASFLLAHVAFIGGLSIDLTEPKRLAISAPLVGIAGVVLGWRLISGARARGDRSLTGPLVAYVAVIATMVSIALATGNPWAAVGALAFMASDAVNGWSRFVRAFAAADLIVMTTYHLALFGLVLSLGR
ncbi:MAG: lysoplasmalogenase [Actinomycetota bacterium]